MKAFLQTLFWVGAAIGLYACSSIPRQSPVHIDHPSVSPQSRVAVATRYRVNGPNSEVHVLVYRGGPLARLGHNHVMTSHDISGDVWIAEQLENSSFELRMPVETLVVDDAQARRAEGADFPAEVPEDAKLGTRKNMLGPDVLDADQFANVELHTTRVTGSKESPQLTLAISLKGHFREVTVPATVAYEANNIVATGEFGIKQTDFGMQPFSVALGMVQVLDELKIKFKIVAVKE